MDEGIGRDNFLTPYGHTYTSFLTKKFMIIDTNTIVICTVANIPKLTGQVKQCLIFWNFPFPYLRHDCQSLLRMHTVSVGIVCLETTDNS